MLNKTRQPHKSVFKSTLRILCLQHPRFVNASCCQFSQWSVTIYAFHKLFGKLIGFPYVGHICSKLASGVKQSCTFSLDIPNRVYYGLRNLRLIYGSIWCGMVLLSIIITVERVFYFTKESNQTLLKFNLRTSRTYLKFLVKRTLHQRSSYIFSQILAWFSLPKDMYFMRKEAVNQLVCCIGNLPSSKPTVVHFWNLTCFGEVLVPPSEEQ